MIDFGCPKCGTTLRVAENAAGQKLPCPKCGQRLKVPEPVEMRTMAGVLPMQKPAAGSNGKQWFYQQDGKPCGPLTWVELKNMVATGSLSPEERVWSEGMTDWKPGGTVPNLFPRRVKPPASASEGDAGKWFEGLGVLFFGGTMGLAFLVFIGFIVWKGVKKTATPDTQAVAATSPAETDSRKETKDRRLEPTEIFEQCSPSVARVQVSGWTGSGFLAKPGIVVTNFHVISEGLANKIVVTFPSAAGGNTPIPATLLHEDRKRDLAILQVETNGKPIPLATKECPRGERVVVIGSPATPDGNVVENSITAGEMNARVPKDDLNWYQISAAINGGNSGGPVFNSHGEVIGIATWTYVNKQAMNYAVPFADIRKGVELAMARDQREREHLTAEHDAVVAFRKLGKACSLHLYAVSIYYGTMKASVEKGNKPADGLKAAAERIDKGINVGAARFLDGDLRAALPRVVGNKALPEGTRQQMEELVALHSDLKDCFDRPRGTLEDYGKKKDECSEKLTRLFQSLRLKLGVNEDPRLTVDELDKLGLPH